MIAIGQINILEIVGADNVVFILSDGEKQFPIPKSETPLPLQLGDRMEVFVYTNKQGELTATARKPFATVGQFAYLKAVDENSYGAFMDLGIGKDLFVPKKEQRWPLIKGRSYVVYIYLDEGNNHMVGSTKLRKFVNQEVVGLTENDEVDLLIYEETDLGYNAIINNEFVGLLYTNELFESLRPGNKRKGWIKKIYDDGKIDLSLQQQGYAHIIHTKEIIMQKLVQHQGYLALGDKSSPEEIYQVFKISKKAFKKAIGALYKERLILVTDTEIRKA